MRIISPFKDYYDSVMKLGQDSELLYLRKSTESPKMIGQWPCKVATTERPLNYLDDAPLQVKSHLVGFCGKIYTFLELTGRTKREEEYNPSYNPYNPSYNSSTHPSKSTRNSTFCYTLEEVDAYINSHFKKKEIDFYSSNNKNNKHRGYWRSIGWNMYHGRRDFEHYFEESKEHEDKHATFFLTHQVPVFATPLDRSVLENTNTVLIFNPCLKDYEFYRIFDPYRAFQELQMYLGGMAKPEKEIPHVSDSDLLEGKGFNKKWSFRKPPEEEKEGKKGKRKEK